MAGGCVREEQLPSLATGLSAADGQQTVSAITVTYYTGPVFWSCIESVLTQPELLELIVIVNGIEQSDRVTLQKRAETDRRIHIVEPGRNLGFAPACNL